MTATHILLIVLVVLCGLLTSCRTTTDCTAAFASTCEVCVQSPIQICGSNGRYFADSAAPVISFSTDAAELQLQQLKKFGMIEHPDSYLLNVVLYAGGFTFDTIRTTVREVHGASVYMYNPARNELLVDNYILDGNKDTFTLIPELSYPLAYISTNPWLYVGRYVMPQYDRDVRVIVNITYTPGYILSGHQDEGVQAEGGKNDEYVEALMRFKRRASDP